MAPAVDPSLFNKPCNSRMDIKCILDVYCIIYEIDYKSNSFLNIGGMSCNIYPQKRSSSAFVYYNESKSEFKTGQKLIEILNGFNISMLTPTCITKEQIQEILDLHNIIYTWDNESDIFSQIDGNDCYINPLHFDGNQPVPACFLYLHLTLNIFFQVIDNTLEISFEKVSMEAFSDSLVKLEHR